MSFVSVLFSYMLYTRNAWKPKFKVKVTRNINFLSYKKNKKTSPAFSYPIYSEKYLQNVTKYKIKNK